MTSKTPSVKDLSILDPLLRAAADRMERLADVHSHDAEAALQVSLTARALVGTTETQAKLDVLEAIYKMVIHARP